MPNFDEAIRATEEMFANQRAEEQAIAEEVPPVPGEQRYRIRSEGPHDQRQSIPLL